MKRLLAIILAFSMLLSVTIFTAVAGTNELTLEKAYIINDTQIKLIFSEPISVNGSVAPFAGIRYGNVGSTPATAGAIKGNIGGSSVDLQFFGKDGNKLVPVEGSNDKEWIWTISAPTTASAKTVTEVFEKTNNNLKAFKDYPVFFCIEEIEKDGSTAKNSDRGTIFNVTAKSDSSKHLKATRIASATSWDGTYVLLDYEPVPVKEIKESEIRDITVEKITIVNDKQVVIDLSEDINIVASDKKRPIFIGMRYTDASHNLKTSPDTMQSYATVEYSGSQILATFDGGVLSSKSLADVIAKKGYESVAGSEDWVVTLALEGKPDADRIPKPLSGYINNVRSASDEYGVLKANKLNAVNANYNGLYFDVDFDKVLQPGEKRIFEGLENASLKYSEHPYKLTTKLVPESVNIIDERQVEVVFPELVKFAGAEVPKFSLCYIDKDNNIVKDNETPLSWAFEKAEVESYRILVTKAESGKSIKDIISKKGYEEKGKDWTVALCIEGVASSAITEPKIKFVDNIQNSDGSAILGATVADDKGIADRWFGTNITGEANAEKPYVPDGRRDITVTSVKIINARQLEVEFSEEIKFNGSKPFMAIRYTNKSYVVQSLDSKALQWEGTASLKGNVLTFTVNEGAPAFDTFLNFDVNDTTKLHKEDWLATFCIEGLANAAIPTPIIGYVDNVISLDGKGMLIANKTHSGAIWDGNLSTDFKGIENVNIPYVEKVVRGVTVESATILNEKQIKFHFSEPVHIVGNNKDNVPVFNGLRYTNSSLSVIYVDLKPQQWTGKLEEDDGDLIFTNGGNKSIADFLAKTGLDNDWIPTFTFEGMPDETLVITDPKTGYVDNIQTEDGYGLLLADTKDNSNGIYDGCHVKEFEGKENLTKKYIPGGHHEITVQSVTIINERQIELVFSEDIKFVGSNLPFMAVRYTYPNNHSVVYIKNNEKKSPMQYQGNATIEGNVMTWTKNPGLPSFQDLLSKKGYEDTDWLVEFCIEGMPDTSGAITNPIIGYVDNIQGTDGKGVLLATKSNSDGVYDGWLSSDILGIENASKKYVPVVVRPTWEEDTREGIDVLSVKILNSTQIQIKFSEPVKLAGEKSPWCCIRYVTYDANGRPQYGTYKTKDGKTVVMQVSGGITWNGKDTVIWNKTSGDSMYDIMNMKAFEGHGKDGYDIMFCIEGITDPKVTSHQIAYIDNVVSLNGKKKLKGIPVAMDLLKNPDGSYRGDYDGWYGEITGIENAKKAWEPPKQPSLTLDKVRVLNGFQLELTFSEPIQIVGSSNPKVFSAIRYTDDNFNVIKDPNAGYLQYMGTVTTSETSNVVKWTLNSGSAKSLADLLQMKGYEKSGYKLTFCFEGMPDDGSNVKTPCVGYIDNIRSIDGKRILKASKYDLTRGVYDGIYITKLEDMENATKADDDSGIRVGVEVESVTITGDYTLEIKFSEAVHMVGEGTAATQYCPVNACIRFTDANLNVQNYEGKKLEFAGDITLYDGEDTATWEIRDHGMKISDLLKKKEFLDFVANFCIEGTEDTELIPDPKPGYVDNIRNMDDSYLLVATKKDVFGITDAFYTSDIIEQSKSEDAIEFFDVNNMTNAEREAYKALDKKALKELNDKLIAVYKTGKAGELSENGKAVFDKLLAKNKISAEDLNAYVIGYDGAVSDIACPITLTYDVSEKKYGIDEKIYVYRINEDGTVSEIERTTATVANGAIKNVKFMTDGLSDFVITTKPLDVNMNSGLPTWLIITLAAVAVAAIAAIAVIAASKKKKDKAGK